MCFIIIVIKYAFQLKGSLKKQYTEISEKQGIVSVYVLFHCHCHKDVVFWQIFWEEEMIWDMQNYFIKE